MSIPCLEYRLHEGYIHNWLVAGPEVIAVPDLDRFEGEDLRLQITRHYHKDEEDLGVNQTPVEGGILPVGNTELVWDYVHCPDDHFVDLTRYYHACRYLRAWAYAQVVTPAAQEVTFVLTTNGAADLWLNGQRAHRQEHFHHQSPQSLHFPLLLEEGPNEILVRFEQVAVRESPYVMALEIAGISSDSTPEDVLVRLPTSVESITYRQGLERVFDAAYLDRDVYKGNEHVIVRWPDAMGMSTTVALRLQTPSGRIYAETETAVRSGSLVGLSKWQRVPEGPYRVVMLPKLTEYYGGRLRHRQEISLWVSKDDYSQTPYGTYQGRRLEALEDAVRQEHSIFAEIAKMELGLWSNVKTDPILEAVRRIDRREDGSDVQLTGLLGMVYRYRDDASFPEELKGPLETCILNFKYWADEPGSDVMSYWPEHHQILFHTCEILAGQLYPNHTFANAGRTGQWHREKGERMAISWLRKRLTGGFREWDSSCCFEKDLLALTHLAGLSETPEVWEMATVAMDKMFFTMAVNSYRGVFGSSHGRTYASLIKGAWLDTAGISRLMWGMGVFNHHIEGTVSLACAEEYELPPIIQGIAADLPEEMWNREHHTGELEEWCDHATGIWDVNKVTYRTPDYMLCSAQDYHPGERGGQEHIWQATMGPDAVVFVTHPPCASEENSHQPNFWVGNNVLPRVAQWRDVLIAVYRLPENDWMGFTHAYFPIYAFDEHVLRDGWAFARKGEGYLALTAKQDLELVTQGPSAYRELRSFGSNNVWLCQMGRARCDGSFGEFQENVLALDVDLSRLDAQLTTLHGESLAFGWEGPLLVNGKERPITGFKHYENPYCVADLPTSQMEIHLGEYSLRLDFAT